MKPESVVGEYVEGTTVKSLSEAGLTVMALVVPALELEVMVIVGVSPAFTNVNPDFVMAPVVKVSLALPGFVGEIGRAHV